MKRLSDSSSLWSGTGFSVLVRFFTTVLIARIAGATEMGAYIAVVTLSGMLLRLLDMSLGHASLFHIRNDKKEYNSCFIVIVCNAVLMAPVLILASYCLRFIPVESQDISLYLESLLVPICMLTFFQMISSGFVALQPALGLYRIFTIAPIFPNLLFIFLVGAMFYVGSVDAILLVKLLACSEGIFSFSLIIMFIKKQDLTIESIPDRAKIRALYKFGIQVHFGVLAKVLSARADRIILTMLLPATAVAYYSLSTTLRDYLLMPGNIFSIKYQNEMLDIRHDQEKMYKNLKKELFRWGLILSFGCLGVFAFSSVFVPLVFGQDFAGSVHVINILVWSAIPLGLAGLCWNIFYALNKPVFISMSIAVPAFLGLPLLAGLSKYYGIEGAAWAILFSSLITGGVTGLNLFNVFKEK